MKQRECARARKSAREGESERANERERERERENDSKHGHDSTMASVRGTLISCVSVSVSVHQCVCAVRFTTWIKRNR